MIYLDTSVALAHLFAEDRKPAQQLWSETLISSRLLQYELWTRLHARRLSASHADAANELVGRLALLDLSPQVLSRALEPFPVAMRTLDALHLASVDFLVRNGQTVQVATYDQRMRDAALAMGLTLAQI